jgi:hypothetical protein
VGKTLKYGSHDFPTKFGFTGSATDAKKVSVRSHRRGDGKIIAEHTRAPRQILKFKYGGDTREGGASGTGTGAGSVSGAGGAGSQGGATHAASTIGGNENAAIGHFSAGAADPTRARDAMSNGAVMDGVGIGVGRALSQSDLGMLGQGVREALNPTSVDDNTVQGIVNTGLGILGAMPGPISVIGALGQFGTGMARANAMKAAAIRSGMQAGEVVGDGYGNDIAEQGGGIYGGTNAGLTDNVSLARDIANGRYSGNIHDYDRTTRERGGGSERTIKTGPLQTLANAQPLLSATPYVTPIIPTVTPTFKKGGRATGKPGFNSSPLYGKR